MYGLEIVDEKAVGSMSGRYALPFTTLAGLAGIAAVDGEALGATEVDGAMDGATDTWAEGGATEGADADATGATGDAADGVGCGGLAHALTIRLVTMIAVTAPQAGRPVMVDNSLRQRNGALAPFVSSQDLATTSQIGHELSHRRGSPAATA
jgi:hypothetical protein